MSKYANPSTCVGMKSFSYKINIVIFIASSIYIFSFVFIAKNREIGLFVVSWFQSLFILFSLLKTERSLPKISLD